MKEKWTQLETLAELFQFQHGRAVASEEVRYTAPIECFVDAHVGLFENGEGIAIVTFGEHHYSEHTIESAYTMWYKIEEDKE